MRLSLILDIGGFISHSYPQCGWLSLCKKQETTKEGTIKK